ncbi:hypothetical protein FO440_21210 [Mucilaginibacter corticis]|uniref:Uncharacterized protein n=1 Tax=Mucilaginibacter corticis TaxID=2597670 RepID=A0A556MBV8_9SPHI|nr:hypothetical protein [Mucilaginibacter corticis]TSJ37285.1 hypothetical protein FO440_21210 [Mucilaginibacter corticis]
MKKLYIPVFILIIFCFTSCVDIEEHYDFKLDGSCNVVYGFDMGRAVSVFKNLMSDSLKQTPQFNLVKDTTMSFLAAMPDSLEHKLSKDELAMANNSNLSIKMDLQKNIMKMSITHTAKNATDLQYYLDHLSKISMGSQLDAVTKKNKQTSGFDAQQLVAGQDYYQYEVTPHKFYRIIDKTKFNAFLKKTQNTLVMAKAMLIDMPYKVILNFAKPVKKVNNPKAIVSADRKHITLVTTMDDMIKNPSVMNLKIDF